MPALCSVHHLSVFIVFVFLHTTWFCCWNPCPSPQVVEYHPEPWDQWVVVGNIQPLRYSHAALSVGMEQLPCLSLGEHILSDWLIDCLTDITNDRTTGRPNKRPTFWKQDQFVKYPRTLLNRDSFPIQPECPPLSTSPHICVAPARHVDNSDNWNWCHMTRIQSDINIIITRMPRNVDPTRPCLCCTYWTQGVPVYRRPLLLRWVAWEQTNKKTTKK